VQNPYRDYPIIAARKAVLEAQEALAKRPGPKGALRVQREKRVWDDLKQLSIVKQKE
jgi:hypothetical protein